MEKKTYDYKLIRSKRKTISLHIDAKGVLSVKAPVKTSLRVIEEIIYSKRRWIARVRQRLENTIELHFPDVLVEGQMLFFLGRQVPIVFWQGKTIELNEQLLFPSERKGEGESQYLKKWYKRQARLILTDRTQQWATRMQASYRKVSIGSARKRWGSCNSLGDIRYSWYLLMLPPHLIDYVVVHELTHIKELNHSPQFWSETCKVLSNARDLRLELHRYCVQ